MSHIRISSLFLFLFIFSRLVSLEPTQKTKLSTTCAKFQNLYFYSPSSTFFSFSKENLLIDTVDTNLKRGFKWKTLDDDTKSKFQNPVRIDGTTIILMERHHSNFFVTHFYHFLEHLLIIWDHFQSHKFPEAKLFIMASDGYPFKFDWQGQNQVTKLLIKALFPKAELMTLQEIKSAFPGSLLSFQSVLTSDRGMDYWPDKPFFMERTLNLYYRDLNKDNLDLMSQKVKDFLEISSYEKEQNLVNVTYIKRQKFRALESSFEKDLIDAIAKLPNVYLHVVDFAEMSFKDQVELVHHSDILVGAHGNGFSHTLFLKPQSTIIELFPSNSLRCEYRIFAQLRDVNYYAWIDDEGLFCYEDLKLASQKGYCGQNPDTEVYLIKPDIQKIVDLIEKEVKAKLD